MAESNQPATALEARGQHLQRARKEYDPAQVVLIKQTYAKDCNDAEFAVYLELSARYDLDPFAKEIWAVKISGRLSIFASHAGLLKVARRPGNGFEGIRSDVVRAEDTFKKVSRAGEDDVEHSYEYGKEAPERGEIIGAWAIAYREGAKPYFFFASMEEYNRKQNVWNSHPSVMIQKCAEDVALREQFSISGVVGAEEMGTRHPEDRTAAPVDPDYGEDEQVAARLRQLFDLLDYTPRKRVLKLAGPLGTGLDEGGLFALVHELTEEAKEQGIDVPAMAVEGSAEELPVEEAPVVT